MKAKVIKPFKRGFIKSKYHHVSFEVFGNPKGRPWMFCHGGPGYHCTPKNLQNFDLKKDMVILFDQRGAGKSQPSTELRENTTAHLVSDMISILDYLQVSKVNLMGGSWGSTLALVFSINYPERVNSMVIRGIFLGRAKDIWEIYKPKKSWSLNQKEKFDLTLGELKKKFKIKNFLTDGLKILKKRDENSLKFAKLWAAYEDLICSKSWSVFDFDEEYLSMAMDISSIEIHYFKHNCFLPTNYILKNIHKIKHIPVHIVQGGDDMVTPVSQARELKRALPNSTLFIDKVGGHSSTKLMNKQIKKLARKCGRISGV